MNLKKLAWSGVLAAAGMVAAPAHATTYVDRIVDIGCHHVNGTCFVTLEKSYFTAGCVNPETKELQPPMNSFRWDNADTENGKRTFAALYGAFLAGRTVEIEIGGCSYQGAPSLVWYHVK